MFKEALRPVWAEINLTNLEYNIDRIKEKITAAPIYKDILGSDHCPVGLEIDL